MYVIVKLLRASESLFSGYDHRSNPKWSSLGEDELHPIIFLNQEDANEVVESLVNFKEPGEFVIKKMGFVD